MKRKDIVMLDDQSPIDEDLKYGLLSFSKLTEEQKNAEVAKMGVFSAHPKAPALSMLDASLLDVSAGIGECQRT